MKKTIAIVILIISFFIIYFLQSNFFTWFTIANVQPNLFIIFVLFIGLFAGKKLGLILGVIFGLFLDIVIGKQIGISCIMFGIVGIIGEYFDKNFSKESRITIMLMIAGTTVLYEAACYIFNIISSNVNVEILSFARTLLIEVVYNIIITIIIYPIMQKLGHVLEENFKSKSILTRYF